MKKILGAIVRFGLVLFCLIFLAIPLIGSAKSEKPSERRKYASYKYVYQSKFAVILTETDKFLVRDNYMHTLFIGPEEDFSRFTEREYVKPKGIEHLVSIPRQYKLEVLSNNPPYGKTAVYYDPAKWKVGDRGGRGINYVIFDEIITPVKNSGKKVQGIKPAWPTWKTIHLGTHKSAKDLRQALVDDEYIRVTPEGDDLLKQVKVASKPTEVDIVVVTVAELGFPNGANRAQIYKKALSLGLRLCPAEVGPQLRLQYMDQPIWEYIIVGMEPMTFFDGRLWVFGVVNGPIGRGLYSYDGFASRFWSGRYRWVFCQHFIDHQEVRPESLR